MIIIMYYYYILIIIIFISHFHGMMEKPAKSGGIGSKNQSLLL